MPYKLTLPLCDDDVTGLKVGDLVLLSGVMVTGRDAACRWLQDTFITHTRPPSAADLEVYHALKPQLDGGVIYHCGPVITRLPSGQYHCVSAGPTTSTRMESFHGNLMRHFNLKGAIGKGGMGLDTLNACAQVPGVYFHTIGGAAALLAAAVTDVLGVYKLDLGVTEAMWVIRVDDFPAVVSMDAHWHSLHDEVRQHSAGVLKHLTGS
jgi:tartrate/fumarate subfamily iron-sulfur-dependent hydro-lyase beta chain